MNRVMFPCSMQMEPGSVLPSVYLPMCSLYIYLPFLCIWKVFPYLKISNSVIANVNLKKSDNSECFMLLLMG